MAQSQDMEGAVCAQEAPAAPLSAAEFRAIYEAEFGYVWNTLRRLGGRERDLEDLCHDVFVALYRGRFDRRRPIRPWLCGIAFRVASDYRRRAAHRREIPVAEDGESPGVPLDEEVAAREERAEVARALDALDLDRRVVIVMHDIDGHSMPEIAAALGAPLNTLYSRLRLGRAEFAAAVRRNRFWTVDRTTK